MEVELRRRKARWRNFGAKAECEILEYWHQHRQNPTIHDLEHSDTFKNADKEKLKNKISNLLNKTLPSAAQKETELNILRQLEVVHIAQMNLEEAKEVAARTEVDTQLREKRAAELDAEAEEEGKVPSSENRKRKEPNSQPVEQQPQKKAKIEEESLSDEDVNPVGDEADLADLYPQDEPFAKQRAHKSHTPIWLLHMTNTTETVPIVLPATAEDVVVKIIPADRIFMVCYTVEAPSFEQVFKMQRPKLQEEDDAKVMYKSSAPARKEFENEFTFPPQADKCNGFRFDPERSTVWIFFDRPPALGMISAPELID